MLRRGRDDGAQGAREAAAGLVGGDLPAQRLADGRARRGAAGLPEAAGADERIEDLPEVGVGAAQLERDERLAEGVDAEELRGGAVGRELALALEGRHQAVDAAQVGAAPRAHRPREDAELDGDPERADVEERAAVHEVAVRDVPELVREDAAQRARA